MLLPSVRDGFTIGIFGSNGKTSTASFLCGIFNSTGLTSLFVTDEENCVYEKNMANIETYKKLKNQIKSDIIVIEITEKILKTDMLNDIDFDMLIHCSISEGSYEKSPDGINKINSIINSSKNIKTVILNTDDTSWKDILIDTENIYLITYGLGSKATVTASSIEYNKKIKFCFCLQRALTDRKNMVIDPMEVPIIINAVGQHNVYNGLAAIASALYMGVDIKEIKSALEQNTTFKGGLKILYENGFAVIDNICDNISSFETGMEVAQSFPYENVHLIFNLGSNNSSEVNLKIIEAIGIWSFILKMTNIYLIDNDATVPAYNYLEKLKGALNNPNINIRVIKGTLEEIEGIIKTIKDNELLLFFCDSSLGYIRKNIGEILDKRILGELTADVNKK